MTGKRPKGDLLMIARVSPFFAAFSFLSRFVATGVAALALLSATAAYAAEVNDADEAEQPLGISWQHQGPLKPGDTVEISVQGFPALTAVEIGAGPPQSEYKVWTHGHTSEQGILRAKLVIPRDVSAEATLVFVVSTHDFHHSARSVPIGLIDSGQPTVLPASPLAKELVS
jgi:hypothetical protein